MASRSPSRVSCRGSFQGLGGLNWLAGAAAERGREPTELVPALRELRLIDPGDPVLLAGPEAHRPLAHPVAPALPAGREADRLVAPPADHQAEHEGLPEHRARRHGLLAELADA